MGLPRVSVIVPVYNRERTLARALHSALLQTFADFEIVVVDDGSTDRSADVAAEMGDPRIRLVRQPTNRGVAAARNAGIRAARGEFFAFLDSDDEWFPEKLDAQLAYLRSAPPEVRLCCTDYVLLRIPRGQVEVRTPRPEEMTYRTLLWGCGVSPGATLLAPKALFEEVGPFDESLVRFEDWDWLLRGTRRWNLGILARPLARVHAGESPRARDVEASAERLREKHLGWIRDEGRGEERIFRAALAHELAAAYYWEDRPALAALHLARSFLHYPLRNREFFVRLWRGAFAASPVPEILVVVTGLDIGGTERHLLQVLPRLDRERFRVRVFYLMAGQRALVPLFEEAGIRVIPPPAPRLLRLPKTGERALFGLLLAAVKLYWTLLRRRPGVVHFFLPSAYLVGGLCALLSPVRARVASRRSLNAYQVRHPRIARVERRLHAKMHAVLGNSRAVLRDLRDEGVPESRLGLIYSGIDLAPFGRLPPKEAARAALGLSDSSLVLVTVANLIPYKGHADLLDALAGIERGLPADWVLLCVGRDEGVGAALVRKGTSLGLDGRVRWLGERRDVPLLLRASDIGVLCSHEEGFANSILEGMAAGLPMVVTDVGGNGEAVVDGITGRVVPPNDPRALGRAILELAADGAKRAAMGAAGGRRLRADFTLRACVSRYEELYGALIEDVTRPVPEALESGKPVGAAGPAER